MRVTYRSKFNKDYWEERWSNIPADAPMENREKYPLKYAEMTINDRDGRILEAGCGAGRILRYYKNNGHRIVGMDFIQAAVDKLKAADPSLDVECGDIRSLRFADASFKYVLAFGLYHNLDTGIGKAIAETYRVLEPGGSVCASIRADNIQTRLTDWLTDYRAKKAGKLKLGTEFHKVNFTRSEFVGLFEDAGFKIESVFPVENMPIFYKFAFFRASGHKKFDESLGRREGYRLSCTGQSLQNFLVKTMPNQFCNIYVLIAKKPPKV